MPDSNVKKIKLVTHNGKFHADEVFATASLRILFEKRGQETEIIRTRDEKIIEMGDIVYDVGRIYDPEKDKFDHHQGDFTEKRENGTPYSSFGLVWKKYGLEICDGEKELSDLIDEKIVQAIDAGDNAHKFTNPETGIKSYDPDDMIGAMNPNRLEGLHLGDEYFADAVQFAGKILKREIARKRLKIADREKVLQIYKKSPNKKIIILPDPYHWALALSDKPEPVYVIHPGLPNNFFIICAIPIKEGEYDLKKPFPKNWRGKTAVELQKITGIETVSFCHKGGYLCATGTMEDAIKLAELSLESSE